MYWYVPEELFYCSHTTVEATDKSPVLEQPWNSLCCHSPAPPAELGSVQKMGCSHHFPSQHSLPHNSRTPQETQHTLEQLTLALARVQSGCVVLTETLAVLHVGTGKHCSKCTTTVCYLQHRSQTTFQTAPQLFALISIEFTCSALKNTCFFSVGLSFLPSLQGTKEAYHQKKTDMDISSLPNLLEAMQTTALTLEGVKTKSHLISLPAWVSD